MTKSFPHPAATEQPLPLEVSIRSDSWLTRARNYPVFSRTWYYYRFLSWVIPLSLIDLVVLTISALSGAPLDKVIMVVVPLSLGLLALGLLGTGLAVLVRKRQWPARKETIGLVVVLLLGAGLSYGLFEGSDKLCKWIAHDHIRHGKIELFVSSKYHEDAEEGKATPPKLTAPASSTSPSAPSSSSTKDLASASVAAESHSVLSQETLLMLRDLIDFLFTCFVVSYLGGGFDLWLFFRQKKRLQEDRLARELKQAQEARREAELRLSVLVAQVEPHFLFNTLAGVRSAINSEPARATAIVDHLVDYLRATIPKIRRDGSSTQARLGQQLDAARAYLNLMQTRIPRLQFTVESTITDAALPPLMLISLVENAVKHGIEPKVGPAHIAVSAHQTDNAGQPYLTVSVSDDGVGFGGTTSGSGLGLENIRERLASMYGENASLVLKANPDGGVTAVISLPLEA